MGIYANDEQSRTIHVQLWQSSRQAGEQGDRSIYNIGSKVIQGEGSKDGSCQVLHDASDSSLGLDRGRCWLTSLEKLHGLSILGADRLKSSPTATPPDASRLAYLRCSDIVITPLSIIQTDPR